MWRGEKSQRGGGVTIGGLLGEDGLKVEVVRCVDGGKSEGCGARERNVQ